MTDIDSICCTEDEYECNSQRNNKELKMREEEDIENRKLRSSLRFLDFLEEKIKQKLVDPKDSLGFSKFSE